MTAETGTELETQQQGGRALENRRLEAGLAEGNGVIDPARWQMLAAISETVYDTAFVPAGLRGNKASTLACLLYGDALGLQPMTSLKEIHVIDGVPGLSAAAMSALVRKAHPGHRLGRTEIRDSEARFLGVTIRGVRGDTEETDEYTFTLEMAARAGLMSKHNWKSYPEAMCTARASSQICTFLFPDVFMGSPLMPEELEGLGVEQLGVGNPETGSPIVPTPPAPAEPELRTDICPIHGVERTELLVAPGRFYCPECKLAGAEGEEPLPTDAVTNQTSWEVSDVDSGECIAYIDADDRNSIAKSGAPFVKFPDVDGKWEIVGYEVDGASGVEKLIVRREAAAADKPAAGTPAAVVEETIPKVFTYVEEARARGDVDFIRGVLDAEKAGKNRGRLVSQLEEQLATIEADALTVIREGDGTGDDNPLLDEPESAEDVPLEGEHEHPVELPPREYDLSGGGFQPVDPEEVAEPEVEADGFLAEVDPEIPYTSATRGAKLVRLAALCAYMEDQWPSERAWHRSGIIGAASRQFGGTIHTLEDLTDEQLELIWKAAEQHATAGVEFLALAKPADVVKLADQAAR